VTEAPGEHPIVLATVVARYSHTAFGQRCIEANMGLLRPRCRCFEFTPDDSPAEMAEAILACNPGVVGLGAYIWNADTIRRLARLLKRLRPALWVVVGGPETWSGSAAADYAADYLVRGEGEAAFPTLCVKLLKNAPPQGRMITPPPCDLNTLALPHAASTDEDIAHRVLYVETSRGCLGRCAFCVSAREHKMRFFPLPPFFAAMTALLARGARRFKFVDRTFNARADRFHAVLEFFLERWQPGMELHLELHPELLSDAMVEMLARFPRNGLHLEVGVQSLTPATLDAVQRPQSPDRALTVLHTLRKSTGARVHADLIAGLPGEGLAAFAAGFDRLISTGIPEIQVGILKRLPGSPMDQTPPEGALFSTEPPYEVLQTKELSFFTLQRLKRFSRHFDRYFNCGAFPRAMELVFATKASAFEAFLLLSAETWEATGKSWGLSIETRAACLQRYLEAHTSQDAEDIARVIADDIARRPRGVSGADV